MLEPGSTLLTMLVIACLSVPVILTDYRHHRIPNGLVLTAIVVGFLLQISAAGLVGLLLAIAGLAIGMLCLLPGYLARSVGAGDVKLMGAMGAILGPITAIMAVLLSLILGSIFALATMANPQAAQRNIPGSHKSLPYAAAICGGSLAAPLALGGLDALVPTVLF